MKDTLRYNSSIFPFNLHFFASCSITVTMLLTAILVVSVIGIYQVESAEAQSTSTSSVSELIDEGNSLFDLGKYEEAIVWFDKAIEVNPFNIHPIIGKGVALASLGKIEDALAQFDKALKIDPTNQKILDAKSQLQG